MSGTITTTSTAGVPAFPTGPALIDGAQLNAFLLAFESGGGHTTTIPAGITAGAGGGQANAVPLLAAINLVMTVATAGDSVSLPLAVGGQVLFVANGSAANPMSVFVLTNDNMNGTRNGSVSVPALKSAIFFSPRPGGWRSVLSA